MAGSTIQITCGDSFKIFRIRATSSHRPQFFDTIHSDTAASRPAVLTVSTIQSMTRTTSTLVVALLLITSTAAPASAALFGDESPSLDIAQRHGQPSYIVSFDNESTPDLQSWAANNSDRHILSLDNETGTATVAAPALDVSAGLLDRALSIQSIDDLSLLAGDSLLANAGYVESVQPNYEHSLVEPVTRLDSKSNASIPQEGVTSLDDPEYPLYGVAYNEDANRTYMSESRGILGVDNVSATGEGVLVAPIDTGTNVANGKAFGNGTLGSSIRIDNASKNMRTGETVNESGWGAIADGNGHGTWVSSSIAANTSNGTHDGVAPDARLLVMKALADDGSGSTADIANAVRYAANEGAHVISMSLGSPVWDAEIVSAVEYAESQGAVVVVAAGNSRQLRSPGVATPGDAENVLTVAATNGSEPPRAASAYFSQYGPDSGAADMSRGASRGAAIDVAAPGMKTVAQVPVANTETQVTESELSGTSMATPMVAGGVALLVAEHPDWESAAYRESVRSGARPVPSAAGTEVGHGMAAVDLSITETTPKREQAEAMTSAATARDEFHRALAADADGLFGLVTAAT
jgi:hypothetical protein